METATIEKQEIYFDSFRFDQDITQWNKKTELAKSIRCELEKYFPGMKINIDSLFPHPEVNIYKLVEKQYVQNNPMGLSGIKLAELKEMDFRYLLNNQIFEYGKRLDLKKPTKAGHTYFAETQDEIKRLKKVNAFIDAVKEFSGKDSFMIPEQNQIHHLTKGAVSVGRNSDLIPNVSYIKDAV